MCYTCFRGLGSNKRKKKAPQVIESMFLKLDFFLKLYKIKFVEIYMKSRISGHFYYLVKELEYYNYGIKSLVWRQKIAHNGVRGRKIRRL